MPLYNNTPIADTFLFPLHLWTQQPGLDVFLDNSTVSTLSDTNMKISFHPDEYDALVQEIYAASFAFSPLVMTFGGSSEIPLSIYCLPCCHVSL